MLNSLDKPLPACSSLADEQISTAPSVFGLSAVERKEKKSLCREAFQPGREGDRPKVSCPLSAVVYAA